MSAPGGRRASWSGCATPACERAVHWLPSRRAPRIERALERFEAAVAELNGE